MNSEKRRRESESVPKKLCFEFHGRQQAIETSLEMEMEIGPAPSRSFDLTLEFELVNLQRQVANVESHIEELTRQRNILLVQIAAEKASTFEEQNTSILILGDSGNLDSIYLLDSKAQSWKKLIITLPVEMQDFGAVVLNEEIYIFGGYANYNAKQGCYKLKNDGTWMQLASLNQKRSDISSSSLVYKGDIWVIGGTSEVIFRESLKSVEKYDISQDKWIYMPEMIFARYGAAAAVFKDRIFVTGGYNEKRLKSVEMFDPKLQKWILFCDLPFEVSGHTMLIDNSTLSIFGGNSESGRLNRVWEMDIEDPEKKWTEKQSFKHPRHSFGIAKLSYGIIIFGGYGGSDTSEIFDGNEWIYGPRLPKDLSFFAYATIPRSLEEKFYLADAKASNFSLINRSTSLELNENQRIEQERLGNQQSLMLHAWASNGNTLEQESRMEQNTSVLILGGWSTLNTIYLLDSKAQSWKKLNIALPVGMQGFGAAVVNEEIYIFGGYANYNAKQGCYKLKNDGTWMQLASLNQKRSDISSSSLVYKGDIWVIGGSSRDFGDTRESLKSVEKYNISQNKWIFFSHDKWTYMPEMNYARRNAAAAVFKDRIFVTGGWNGEILESVEMFDPELQKWILFCDLPFGLYAHTMLISNSTLSIFGGSSESRRLNSVWEMDIEDPETKWTQKQSFKHPRHSFGIGKLSNGIIVFGGWRGNGTISEIFDGNEWIDGPRLPKDLSFFAYASIPRSLEERFLETFFRQEQPRNQQNLTPNAQSAVRTESKVEKQSGGQQNTSVLILGGSFCFTTIYLLDSKAQSWKKLRITLPMGMRDFGAVILNEEIYIFGGSFINTYHQHCYKLKNDGTWMQLASLNQKRSDISSSSLVYKGGIWAIGGCLNGFSLNSVEKYDISQDKWIYMPEMIFARYGAAASVFKDRIFVTGGRNRERLKSVEMFDPQLQKWILFCDLPFEVSGHTMLIDNSTLSIFGGSSESRRLNSVWEMDIEDPETKWTQKQRFNHLRAAFGIEKLSNGIIVFGGLGGSGKTSEIFDGNKWIKGPKLPQILLSFAYTSIPRSLEERLLEQFS